MPFHVRLSVPNDAHKIAALARTSNIADSKRKSKLSVEAILRDGFGKSPAFQAIIAETKQEITGYSIFYWGYDTHSASRGIYIADLFVANHHRRSGIGSALVSFTANYCMDGGGKWMFWSVLKNNNAARTFYRKFAPELKDVLICGAFGKSFEKILSLNCIPKHQG